jgi:hypothetical protein
MLQLELFDSHGLLNHKVFLHVVYKHLLINVQ